MDNSALDTLTKFKGEGKGRERKGEEKRKDSERRKKKGKSRDKGQQGGNVKGRRKAEGWREGNDGKEGRSSPVLISKSRRLRDMTYIRHWLQNWRLSPTQFTPAT